MNTFHRTVSALTASRYGRGVLSYAKKSPVGRRLVAALKSAVKPAAVAQAPELHTTTADRFSLRVRQALHVRANAVNDFFGGWEVEDLAFLERWQVDLSGIEAPPGELVDWLGCRTAKANHGWLGSPESGAVVGDLPVPDDSVHAETIEYVALLTSIDRALQAKQKTFCVVELGSSYGPWSVAATVVARRHGLGVVAHAVEANAETLPLIADHCRRNGLEGDGQVRFQAHHAAISLAGHDMFFPRIDTRVDNGAQATGNPVDVDYRGVKQEYVRVPGLGMADLFEGLNQVDFLHMDLQGAEQELLESKSFCPLVSGKVAILFLATQSRLIEGLALRQFSSAGWTLLRERPTTFQPNERTVDVNGWTTRDGGQIWVNSRFNVA
jgi:FkbM family methyltransferase